MRTVRHLKYLLSFIITVKVKICEFYISSELIFFYSETGCVLLTCFQNENQQVPSATPQIYIPCEYHKAVVAEHRPESWKVLRIRNSVTTQLNIKLQFNSLSLSNPCF